VTFGVSSNEAKNKAEPLAENYGCNDEIRKLIQQARIEPLSHWCSQHKALAEIISLFIDAKDQVYQGTIS